MGWLIVYRGLDNSTARYPLWLDLAASVRRMYNNKVQVLQYVFIIISDSYALCRTILNFPFLLVFTNFLTTFANPKDCQNTTKTDSRNAGGHHRIGKLKLSSMIDFDIKRMA